MSRCLNTTHTGRLVPDLHLHPERRQGTAGGRSDCALTPTLTPTPAGNWLPQPQKGRQVGFGPGPGDGRTVRVSGVGLGELCPALDRENRRQKPGRKHTCGFYGFCQLRFSPGWPVTHSAWGRHLQPGEQAPGHQAASHSPKRQEGRRGGGLRHQGPPNSVLCVSVPCMHRALGSRRLEKGQTGTKATVPFQGLV